MPASVLGAALRIALRTAEVHPQEQLLSGSVGCLGWPHIASIDLPHGPPSTCIVKSLVAHVKFSSCPYMAAQAVEQATCGKSSESNIRYGSDEEKMLTRRSCWAGLGSLAEQVQDSALPWLRLHCRPKEPRHVQSELEHRHALAAIAPPKLMRNAHPHR